MGVIWDHTLKWDKSPWGPWCRHSFKAGDAEVTVEPYLFGEEFAAPWYALGAYTVTCFTWLRPVVSQDLDATNAMFILYAFLEARQGDPVLVRVPKAEIIRPEGSEQ